MNPGQTPFGVPMKQEELGETEIPQEMFTDFLQEIQNRFSFATYNVIQNNCNHFTNECCNFLLGKDIPHSVLKQAEELIATPLGQMIRPMLEQSQDQLKQGTPMFDQGAQPGAATGAGGAGGQPTEVIDIATFQELMFTSQGLVIDFWSPGCPPCVQFKPEF